MTTYSQEQWADAQAAWEKGEFSPEWKPWRHEAAMEAGIIFPPDGTKWDSWEDDSPSQRAMLYRAICETPELLHEAIRRSKAHPSWSTVLGFLLGGRDEMRQRLDEEDRDRERREEGDRVDHRQSVMVLSEVLKRIGDSR